MGKILFVLIVGLAIGIWLHFDAVKRLALAAASKHCKEMGVQLLDQTVVLRGVGISRNFKGMVVLACTYSFEFSTNGERRFHGVAQYAGKRLLRVQLEPHTIH